ncbi:MAG TPA: nuclease (SNase) [Rhodospirillaceae bacterium]|nr:nuclease (SNase) [Rhodospirillaceae bacterium]HAA92552.1 nuclease (SNase) [Rhodospirillaceae bacterium]HAT34671.1 nuclease (SNase) [Rhodospirillaceae bacterium]|tara:strand:+ start:218 stop:985 length:768 start_codon:yes stop_codon:yes gene_type:complete
MRLCWFSIFFLAFLQTASAGELIRKGTEVAVEIIDGDTLVLKSGKQVRLVGLQAPKLPLGRKGFRAWPLGEKSRRRLEKLTLGRRLMLSFGGREIDRHGRLLAHLHDAAGTWIQGEMLQAGMARVYSFRDNRALVSEMLSLEREARANRRGIWRHPFYRVRNAENAGRYINSFQLVEGRVFKVAERRKRTYINFDEDWRSDFTISVKKRHLRTFKKSGVSLSALAGKRVRVRGWIKNWNGPFIEATHPEQIEILD